MARTKTTDKIPGKVLMHHEISQETLEAQGWAAVDETVRRLEQHLEGEELNPRGRLHIIVTVEE